MKTKLCIYSQPNYLLFSTAIDDEAKKHNENLPGMGGVSKQKASSDRRKEPCL